MNVFIRRKNGVLLAGLLSICFSKTYAQSDWKNWNSLAATFSASKKLDLRIAGLSSFNMTNGYSNDFSQMALQADYKLNKHYALRASTMFTFSGNNTTVRGIIRGTHQFKLNKKLNWANALQLEYHSASETRYRARAIYVTRLAMNKRIKFLNLAPSLSYWLYFNAGGDPIQYYNEDGSKGPKQASFGFHRGRFMANVNSKISDHFSVSLYYMNQSEFNLLTPKYREINVLNPNTGNVTRDFNNYNVIGISGLFNYDLYHKKKKKSKKKKSSSTNIKKKK